MKDGDFHAPPLNGRSRDTWIAPLFSGEVATAEACPSLVDHELYPEELAVIARAVPKRRAEFGTARLCARYALSSLGFNSIPLVPQQDGAPRWPPGASGSMSHTTGYCGAAVARSDLVRSLGLDVERDRELDVEVVETLCTPHERRVLASRRRARQDAIVYFGAKEAFYKLQFPLTRTFLDFQDVEVAVEFDSGTFSVRVLRPHPHALTLEATSGRFLRRHGLVMCAMELAARASCLVCGGGARLASQHGAAEEDLRGRSVVQPRMNHELRNASLR